MSKRKSFDPQAAQEALRYETPVPSRKFIMQLLEERGAPTSHRGICRLLAIEEPKQQEAIMFRLKAMVRDGQLLQNRRGAFALIGKLDLIKGRIQGNKDGYGFLIPDERVEDLYLSAREMRQLFDGDRALARESGIDRRGRKEGQVIEVIERNTTHLVGRYMEKSGTAYIEPENKRINREVVVKPGVLVPTIGQYVLLEIIEQPTRRSPPIGMIKEILGDRTDAGMEVDVALRAHDIPHVWPDTVEKQAAKFSHQVLEKDKKHRVDLRAIPFVTIDGEDARDFDDAVYCEPKKSGGWRLFVAIADVSHYVKVNSALDTEAKKRGTSVYFPGHVIPMLPEVLSNGLCSLNPNVDRLAMVCEMTISAKGTLSGYKFYEGLIKSHARLTYNQVWQMLSTPLNAAGEALRQQWKAVFPHIKSLYALYNVLKEVRNQRGTIDFDTVETRIIFGAQRKIDRIVPTERNHAHKLIEECMLCANVAAARFLEKHKVPGLYRVHEEPSMEKRLNLNSFLGSLGLSVPSGKMKPKAIQLLLKSINERPDFPVIQTVVLRSMSQAIYSANNQGHFGLAFSAYTHFTSPIRRYPDLLVHRAIRHIIRSDVESLQVKRVNAEPLNKKTIYPYDMNEIEALGEACSKNERRADEATRDAMNWLKCEYMQQHIGQTFKGLISSVTGFGLFVELQEIYVEGLVHISSLPGDYYQFDGIHHRLVGERTGRIFRLGDELEVTVARVSLDDKKIDFDLSSSLAGNRTETKNSKRKNLKKKPKEIIKRNKSAAAKAQLLKKARAAQQADEKKGKQEKLNKKSNKGKQKGAVKKVIAKKKQSEKKQQSQNTSKPESSKNKAEDNSTRKPRKKKNDG
ncbi:MAG: ribonuclease R [Endozoicomonas sp. (ex Botrylloides leachii)]|nr:ribonuclease R [Endozoicomonas sp. (ex Botrylloides leachii)]